MLLRLEIEIRHTPEGSVDWVSIALLPSSPTAFTLTTFGSNLNATIAIASGTSDFTSTANRRVSPTFMDWSAGPKVSCALLPLVLIGVMAASIGLAVMLAKVAPASEARFVFTAATCVAAVLLTSDLGAGTKAGISSAGLGVFAAG